MTRHILVVDDEADIRDLLVEFLGTSGFRVTAVPSAHEADEAVRRDAPDLIISDLQLEDSDGLEMIAKLKAALPSTPVILLTGVLFDPKAVWRILGMGVSAYLPKTSTLARILEEVRRLLPE
jgi:DNA-binding response OmpR family regulator